MVSLRMSYIYESTMSGTRYVILEHTLSGIHYDLMLEEGGIFKTWRLSGVLIPGQQVAEALPAHRLHYLDYEGPVSGNRGSVRRMARGTYSFESVCPTESTLILQGDLIGRLTLIPENEKRWRLIWTPASP
jgi:hypothetical protein